MFKIPIKSIDYVGVWLSLVCAIGCGLNFLLLGLISISQFMSLHRFYILVLSPIIFVLAIYSLVINIKIFKMNLINGIGFIGLFLLVFSFLISTSFFSRFLIKNDWGFLNSLQGDFLTAASICLFIFHYYNQVYLKLVNKKLSIP